MDVSNQNYNNIQEEEELNFLHADPRRYNKAWFDVLHLHKDLIFAQFCCSSIYIY